MKSDFDILKALLRDVALARMELEYKKDTLVLEESSDPEAPYSIRIRNLPEDVIALKADTFCPPKQIFQGNQGECKRGDFVIFASDNKKKWIIYVEMQGGKSKLEREVIQQLRGAQCLVAYCRAIGQEFWKEPNFLKTQDYRQRFVSFTDVGVQKQPTRPPKLPLHDVPERMLKINAPSVSREDFYKLV